MTADRDAVKQAVTALGGDQASAPGKGTVRAAVFPVGVDYYPLDEGSRSWADWYERDVESDFAAFAKAGLALVRVFLSWHFFEQQVGQYADEAFERLDRLVAAARAEHLRLIVTFFAEDGTSDLTSVPWAKGRDPRTDPYLVQREVALVQRVVNRLRSERAVFAWDLANEPYLAGFADAATLEGWANTLREAVREIDGERPITLSADAETLFKATGVDPSVALDLCGFVASHVTEPYRVHVAEGPISARPVTYLDSFLLHAARRGLPVLVGDVGTFSLDFSAAEEAAHTRVALYSALMNGAAGAMLRRWRDAAVEDREPYFRDPYEVLVGVADTSGRPKTALAEVRRFSRVAARLGVGRHAPPAERAAVMVPAERWEALPQVAGVHAARSCLQAYIVAKEAHVPVTVVREGDGLEGARMLVVPSAVRLRQETWEALAAFVQSGGALVASYGGGDADPSLRRVFGVDFLGDDGPRDTLSCRVAQPGTLGALTSFDAALPLEHYAMLTAAGALVVATDAVGNPLLTLHSFGQGRAVFVAAPAERALANPDTWVAPSPVRAMLREAYRSLAGPAGAGAPYACDSPEVEASLLTGADDDVLIALNHDARQMTAAFTFERRVAAVTDVRGGGPVEVPGTSFGVPLGPFGVAVLRVTYA